MGMCLRTPGKKGTGVSDGGEVVVARVGEIEVVVVVDTEGSFRRSHPDARSTPRRTDLPPKPPP